MLRKLNKLMLLLVIIAVTMTSAFRVTTVYADDGSSEPVPEETAPPPVDEETSAEETLPTEEPVPVPEEDPPAVVEEAVEPAEVTATEPATVEEAVEPPATEVVAEPAASESTPGESLPVHEFLEQLPEDTELIVLNEENEVEPLATTEAAEIIVTGDPMWCPAGTVPGAAGCTSSFGTFTALIDALQLDALSGAPIYGGQAGTIWVASSYNGADDNAIVFDGAVLTNLNNYSLTIQGGWSGTSGDSTVGSASLADVSVSFVNWTGNLTINNFNIDVTSANSTNPGLYIDTVGNITLDNVSVVDDVTNTLGSGDGAFLHNTRDPNIVGNVTISNSNFNGNSQTGLYIATNGTATLNTVQANANGYGLDITADAGIALTSVTAASNNYFGGILDTTFGTGAITVTNSSFGADAATGNGLTGLHAVSGSSITLANVTASYNGTNGAYLEAEGDILVSGAFNGNVLLGAPEDPGLYAWSNGGNITLNGVTANQNLYGAGVVLNTTGSGTITVNGGFFNQNGTFGIQAGSEDGDITLNDVTASYNQVKGAYLGAFWAGNIIVNNSVFVENGSYGIYAFASEGNINLDLVTVTGSDGAPGPGADDLTDYGAVLEAGGDVSIIYSIFQLNTVTGLEITSGGQVDLSSVVADSNGGNGVEVYSLSTAGPICEGDTPVNIVVNVDGGTFANNGGYGLMVKPGPQGTLAFVNPSTFGGNGLGDYLIDLSQEYKDCTVPPIEDPVEPPNEPNVVDVPDTGAEPVEQDCDQFSSIILKLSHGTQVEIGCPFEGFSRLQKVLEGDLPSPLGLGTEFVDAIELGLTDGEGNAILHEDGSVTISFVIPEGSEATSYSILYWDPTLNNGAGGYVELPPYEAGTSFPLHPGDPEDGRTIISGVKQVGNVVTVTVNFPGVFVLVEK